MGRVIGGLDAQARRQRRHEDLLDAGMRLFATQGYSDTPIDVLCQTAKVSTKSFYELFDSKETCYLALMRRTTQRLQDRMGQALSTRDLSNPRATGEALLDSLAHAFAEEPNAALVLFGRGTATTAAVERERRLNRRWAAALVEDLWLSSSPANKLPAGIATGAVGGIFDIVADWASDIEGPPALDEAALHGSLRNFYSALRAGATRPEVTGDRPS